MDLSIIIVSWKTRELVRKALASIFKYTQGLTFEVIVVDNNSGDGTVEVIQREFPQIKLIASPDNSGFSKGNNLGYRQSSGEFILLLNPDTELIDNSLLTLVDFLRQHPQAGVVGPKLLNLDLTWQPSARLLPKLADQLMILTKLPNFFPNLIAKYTCQDIDSNQTRMTEQVMGAALLTRRSIIQQLGLLDEGFWIWFEEVDFCARVLAASWQIWYYPVAKILHNRGQSFSQQRAIFKQYQWNKSLIHYAKKHWPKYQVPILYVVWPFSLLLACLQQLVGIRRKKPDYL